MKRTEVYQVRLSKDEKALIKEASEKGEYLMSSVIRTGAIKEAKRILKQIEKDK